MATVPVGRLSAEDIERMVKEAEEFADEDKAVKERVDARNALEGYAYNIKNQLDDEEKGLGGKVEGGVEQRRILLALDQGFEPLRAAADLDPVHVGIGHAVLLQQVEVLGGLEAGAVDARVQGHGTDPPIG